MKIRSQKIQNIKSKNHKIKKSSTEVGENKGPVLERAGEKGFVDGANENKRD